jgi:hypothetical protein
MTTDFDKEIVKAAEEMVSAFGQDGPWKPLLVDALLKAIAAKREALRPKLAPFHEIIRAAHNAAPIQNTDCEIICQTRADVLRVVDLAAGQVKASGAGGMAMYEAIRAALVQP